MLSKRPRLPWWSLPIAGWIAMLLLGALGIWQLLQAGEFAARFKQEQVQSLIRTQLEPLLVRRDPAELQAAVSGLVHDRQLQLSYLEVREANGRVLVFDGRLESLRMLGVPAPISDRLKAAAYRWSEPMRVLPLRNEARPALQARYLMLRSVPGEVPQTSLVRLQWAGLLSLLLAIGIGTASAMSWQRPPAVSPEWREAFDLPAAAPASPPPTSAAADASSLKSLADTAAALLDDADRALILVDREGVIDRLNASAARLTGWKIEDAQGLPVYSVFHPMDARHAPLLTPAEVCLREARAYPAAELHLRARDGAVRRIEVLAVPLRRSGDDIQGAVMLFHDIAEREARAEQWRRQARLSQAVVDHLVEGVLTTDPAGVIRAANARALRMFGYGRDELNGLSATQLMPVPFLNSPSVRLSDYVGAERAAGLPRVIGWRRDATSFPLELMAQTMSIDQSEGLVLIVRDISERLRSENIAQRLGRLLDAAAEEVYILDAQSLLFVEVNRGARRNLGYQPGEMTRMTPLSISQELEADTFLNYLARLRSGEAEHIVYRCRHRRADGTAYPVEVRLHFSSDEEPPVFMAIAVDISERERDEERLRYLAHHDSLTGLPNRATLEDRLSQALLAARRSSRQVGVLFMDVDRFKGINDTYGHEVGDAVLRQVAARLQNLLRASDTVARLGGDEFVVVASGLRVEQDVITLAQKIHRAFEAALDLPGEPLKVSLSIGIAVSPIDDSDADQLLHHADLAMYQAKQGGPGRWHLHQAEVSTQRRRQLDLERGLQPALVLSQLRLEFSPVLDAPGGRLRAALAGFYWQHPLHGRIEAAEAVASASRSGVIADLELWRLSQAAAVLASGALSDLSLIVPLSGWQLRHPDLAAQIGELVERHGLKSKRLILVADAEGLRQARSAAADTLQRLQAHGLRLGLQDRAERIISVLGQDDLPALDLIALDADEVRTLSPPNRDLIARLMQLAQAAGLPVLASGVDTAAVSEWLQAQGCGLIAGCCVHAPMETEAFAVWSGQRMLAAL